MRVQCEHGGNLGVEVDERRWRSLFPLGEDDIACEEQNPYGLGWPSNIFFVLKVRSLF